MRSGPFLPWRRRLKRTFPFFMDSSAWQGLKGKGEMLGSERSAAATGANHPFDDDGTCGPSFGDDVSVEPRMTFELAVRLRDFVLKGNDPREGDSERLIDMVTRRRISGKWASLRLGGVI